MILITKDKTDEKTEFYLLIDIIATLRKRNKRLAMQLLSCRKSHCPTNQLGVAIAVKSKHNEGRPTPSMENQLKTLKRIGMPLPNAYPFKENPDRIHHWHNIPIKPIAKKDSNGGNGGITPQEVMQVLRKYRLKHKKP